MQLGIDGLTCRQCSHLLCCKRFGGMEFVLAKLQMKLPLRNPNNEHEPGEEEKTKLAISYGHWKDIIHVNVVLPCLHQHKIGSAFDLKASLWQGQVCGWP